jgi:3-dehydroquinate synthase
MSSLMIRASQGEYEVVIGSGLVVREAGSHHVAVMDPVLVGNLAMPVPIIEFDAREVDKNLAGVERLLIEMNRAGLKRGQSLFAIGGGVIQDVSTLAASLYMRGVPWTYAPSTMMAMLDSCIGGKSSINAGGIKNLVGNIYPPTRVIVDVSLAQSLPIEARVAGYAEALKICFAGGAAAFDRYMEIAIPARVFGDESVLQETVLLTAHVLSVKKWFIEVDEFDKRERLLLNFGHTFGHALESALNFSIPHGIGVAIGMCAAIHFGEHRSVRGDVLIDYNHKLAAELPVRYRTLLNNVDWDVFTTVLQSDKKGTAHHLRFVVPNSEGDLALAERDRTPAILARARAATEEALHDFADSVGASE